MVLTEFLTFNNADEEVSLSDVVAILRAVGTLEAPEKTYLRYDATTTNFTIFIDRTH